MWFGTEEDSPTNKAKSLMCSPPPPPSIKGAIAPSTACTRARGKTACVRVRARVYTRVRVHRRASLLDINAQGDTTRKKWRFFSKKP